MPLEITKGRKLDVGKPAGTDVSGADAAVGEVAAPKTFFSIAPPIKTGTMPTVALDPALNAYPAGYHAGAASLTAVDADLVQLNIKLGHTIFGVVGTMVSWIYYLQPSGGDGVLPGLSIPVPIIAPPTVAESHAGGGFTATPTLSVPAPTLAITAAQATIAAFDAGVAHNDDVGDTDETAQTNSAAINDMDLAPVLAPASGDGFYFGMNGKFDGLTINIGTAGTGTYTIAWKYWNGGAWVALTLTNNNSINHFKTTGLLNLAFIRPGDWAVINIAALGDKYYIKAEITMGTMTVKPLGTQAWALTY